MGEQSDAYALRTSVSVSIPPERAFALFTDGLARWWIPEFTWSGPDALARIGIEPHEGGLCYELSSYGLRLDWGRVLTWEAPHRLSFTWHISPQRLPQPDAAHASQVAVQFRSADAGTKVELEHRRFDRHGPGAEEYRDQMVGGWEELLTRYVAAAQAS
jgi:uncharacterized protein YndB with AHSA1/START domain